MTLSEASAGSLSGLAWLVPEFFLDAKGKRKNLSKIKSLRGPFLCGWRTKVKKTTWGLLLLQAYVKVYNLYLTQ